MLLCQVVQHRSHQLKECDSPPPAPRSGTALGRLQGRLCSTAISNRHVHSIWSQALGALGAKARPAGESGDLTADTLLNSLVLLHIMQRVSTKARRSCIFCAFLCAWSNCFLQRWQTRAGPSLLCSHLLQRQERGCTKQTMQGQAESSVSSSDSVSSLGLGRMQGAIVTSRSSEGSALVPSLVRAL